MKTQHTPGPWEAVAIPEGPYAFLSDQVWAGNIPICTTNFQLGSYNAQSAEVQHANCVLIAAAPDLLATLQEIEAKYQAVMGPMPKWAELTTRELMLVREAWYGAALIARAALTKATGERG